MADLAKQATDIIIGKIVGVYGVKGWLKIMSYTRPRENICQFEHWTVHIDNNMQRVSIEQCKPQGKGLIAKLVGIDDRDTAQKYLQCDLSIQRLELPELADGEYYWHDLIGFSVHDQHQQDLGKVTNIFETGANDVFEVTGDKRRLIPWVNDVYISKIDMEASVIVVDWQDEE